jgi:hypothetical protein
MPPYASLRSLRCSRKSLRCFFACRLCAGARAMRDRMAPSQETIISIQTLDTRCMIFPCKIPANLLCNIRGLAHRVGHGSHAERHQSPHAPFSSGTLERLL